MRYEWIFGRLDKIFLHEAGRESSQFLELCQIGIRALQEEIFTSLEGSELHGRFRIVMHGELVSGRFVQIKVERRESEAESWETWALAYLDTKGEEGAQYVYRYQTVIGQKQIVICSRETEEDDEVIKSLNACAKQWEEIQQAA